MSKEHKNMGRLDGFSSNRLRLRRLKQYLASLIREAESHMPLLSALVNDEMLFMATLDAGFDVPEVEALISQYEKIVPMDKREYLLTVDVLWKLIYQASPDLYEDIKAAFVDVLKEDFDADDFSSVYYLDRRTVIRRLADIYAGLVRFRLLQEMEKEGLLPPKEKKRSGKETRTNDGTEFV